LINSQLPVLLVVEEVITSLPDSEFLCFLPVIGSKTNVQKVLSSIQPKAIISIGRATNTLSVKIHYIPFEYRKKWLHFKASYRGVFEKVEDTSAHNYHFYKLKLSSLEIRDLKKIESRLRQPRKKQP
ncbi:MAG: hypothetical protein EBU80_12805, partial [Chitinophagia bacterium]|nr:hypothetical protein [Chitinophagia bacterium]